MKSKVPTDHLKFEILVNWSFHSPQLANILLSTELDSES